MAFPHWLILLVPLIPATVLRWLDRPRIAPGHCLNCGYDLTGNTGGRYPKCGVATGRQAQASNQDSSLAHRSRTSRTLKWSATATAGGCRA